MIVGQLDAHARAVYFFPSMPLVNEAGPSTALFLCAGNTCRSPLVAALARHKFKSRGWRFLSAGLHVCPGQQASPGSRLVAAELGIELDGHAAQQVSPELLHQVDWVIAMTRTQVAIFRQRFPGFGGKIGLLGSPGVNLVEAPNGEAAEEVADPLGGQSTAYRAMADQVERLLGAWDSTFGRRPG